MSGSQYLPGVCNIGGAEVKRRKQVFQLGAVVFVALAIYLGMKGAEARSGLIAFIPAMIAAVGYVQSRKKFCFAFGLMGTFNFAEAGKMSKVVSPAEIAADRKQAIKIIGQSIGLASIATLLLLAFLAL